MDFVIRSVLTRPRCESRICRLGSDWRASFITARTTFFQVEVGTTSPFGNIVSAGCRRLAPYYTTTLLSASVTPTAIYDLEAQIDAHTVLDPDDIEKANELLYKGNISSKDKQKLTFYFKRSKNMIEQYEPLKQQEIVSQMRHFVRFYEFLLQVSCFEDIPVSYEPNEEIPRQYCGKMPILPNGTNC